jgi:hypothetical protein
MNGLCSEFGNLVIIVDVLLLPVRMLCKKPGSILSPKFPLVLLHGRSAVTCVGRTHMGIDGIFG